MERGLADENLPAPRALPKRFIPSSAVRRALVFGSIASFAIGSLTTYVGEQYAPEYIRFRPQAIPVRTGKEKLSTKEKNDSKNKFQPKEDAKDKVNGDRDIDSTRPPQKPDSAKEKSDQPKKKSPPPPWTMSAWRYQLPAQYPRKPTQIQIEEESDDTDPEDAPPPFNEGDSHDRKIERLIQLRKQVLQQIQSSADLYPVLRHIDTLHQQPGVRLLSLSGIILDYAQAVRETKDIEDRLTRFELNLSPHSATAVPSSASDESLDDRIFRIATTETNRLNDDVKRAEAQESETRAPQSKSALHGYLLGPTLQNELRKLSALLLEYRWAPPQPCKDLLE